MQDAGARVVENRRISRAWQGTVKISSWVRKQEETVAPP